MRQVRVYWNSAVAALLVVTVCLPIMPTTARAARPEVQAGGAPARGSGPNRTPPLVRVVDGKTFETTLNENRSLVSLVGIAVAPANTDCGREAARMLQSLATGGLQLEEDATVTFDARKRRVYHALTQNGRSVAQELVRAGVARVTAEGEARHRCPADEAAARASGTGCLWDASAGAARLPSPAPCAAAAPGGVRGATADRMPANFINEPVVAGLNTPTGIAFVPDGCIFVTEKAGRVRVVRNGALLDAPLLDISGRDNTPYGHVNTS